MPNATQVMPSMNFPKIHIKTFLKTSKQIRQNNSSRMTTLFRPKKS